MKQTTDTQVTLILENKLQNEHFQENVTTFLPTYRFTLNLCQDSNVHRYAVIQELKEKAFAINSQNIKQQIGIQVTFILKINL